MCDQREEEDLEIENLLKEDTKHTYEHLKAPGFFSSKAK